MHTRTVLVGSAVGLHARPASLIAEAAARFSEPVYLTLEPSGQRTDAGSSLMVMALNAEYGDTVTVSSDNARAMETIASMVEQELDVL